MEEQIEKKSKIKIFLKDYARFLKNKYVLTIVITSLAFLIIIWLLWILKITTFSLIYSPLITNRSLGFLSNYSLPIFVLIIFIVNFYLAKQSFYKEKLASFFLLGASFFAMILTLILIRFYLVQGF